MRTIKAGLILLMFSGTAHALQVGDLEVLGRIIGGNLQVSSLSFTNGSTQTAAGISNVTIWDHGTLLGGSTWFNFTGTGVTLSLSGNKLTADFSGSAGGGGASSLAIGTGSAIAVNIISSPTAIINFSSGTFFTQVKGGATAFVFLDFSSVTAQGNDPFAKVANLDNFILAIGTNTNLLSSTNVWTGGNTWIGYSTFSTGVNFSSTTFFSGGTVSSPSIADLSNPKTGFYRSGVNTWGFASNGTAMIFMGPTGVTLNNTLTTVSGASGVSSETPTLNIGGTLTGFSSINSNTDAIWSNSSPRGIIRFYNGGKIQMGNIGTRALNAGVIITTFAPTADIPILNVSSASTLFEITGSSTSHLNTPVYFSSLTVITTATLATVTMSSPIITSNYLKINGVPYFWTATPPTVGQVPTADANNNIAWQTPTGGGGGGASSLGVGTGTALAATVISSPTSLLSFDTTVFKVSLKGGSTGFVQMDYSSITAQGSTPFTPITRFDSYILANTTNTNLSSDGNLAISSGSQRFAQVASTEIFSGPGVDSVIFENKIASVSIGSNLNAWISTLTALVAAINTSTTNLANSTTVLVNQTGANISNRTYYVSNESTGTNSVFNILLSSPSGSSEIVVTKNMASSDGLVRFSSNVTTSGDPGVTVLPAGVWSFTSFVSAATLASISQLVITVSTMSQDGITKTEILSSTSAPIGQTTAEMIDMIAVQTRDIFISTSDRILVQYFARTQAAIAINISLYYAGSVNFTHLSVPLSAVYKFIQLSDMPKTLIGQKGKYLTVNDNEISGVFVSTITDNFNSYTSTASASIFNLQVAMDTASVQLQNYMVNNATNTNLLSSNNAWTGTEDFQSTTTFSGSTICVSQTICWVLPSTTPASVGQKLGITANIGKFYYLAWTNDATGSGGSVGGLQQPFAFNGVTPTAFSTMSVTDPFGRIANVTSGSSFSTFTVLGATAPYRSFSIPAPAWFGVGLSSSNEDVNGFVKTSSYTASSRLGTFAQQYFEMKNSTRSMIQTTFEMPYEWDGSSVGITVTWYASSGTANKNVRWAAGLVGYSSGTTVNADSIFTSSVAVNSTYTGGFRTAKSPVISLTPEGTVKGGDLVKLMLFEDGPDGGDDFDGIPRFLNASILWRQAIFDGSPR